MTGNLSKRIAQHREGIFEGKSDTFSARYRSGFVVHTEEFGEVRDALAREKQLKNWDRAWKEELVSGENPEWVNLMPEG
jgi:putative endonuclease